MFTNISKENVYDLSIRSHGIVPGIIKAIADKSVPVAFMYVAGNHAMQYSSLNELESNAIELWISVLNRCESCVKGHSFLSKKAGLSESDVQAIINGVPTSIQRLNMLLHSAEIIYSFGNTQLPDDALNFLEENAVTEQEVFEIVGLISLKTISNYINNYLGSVKKKIA